ncbi:MAG: GntR family transcriptional regulator YhfZ [Bacilli bacterium]
MDIKKSLLSKNGLATLALAREFMKYPIGEKIPTVTDFCDSLMMSRGTVQNSLKMLTDNDVIKVESKGHMGSYLIHKNTRALLEFANITTLVGAMPLPYSKKYEGLASGLIAAMENIYDIPVSMAYMRGAKNRVCMLLANRYDFAIISNYAAKSYIAKYGKISIVKNFGPYTYLGEHVLFFHNKNAKVIEDGMKVGIDFDSYDQKDLTEKLCEGKKVKYVAMEYSQLLQRVQSGELDATVWNRDAITTSMENINFQEFKLDNLDNTEAVMVVNNEREEISMLLKEIIDVETVLNIQKLVVEKKITPSY